MKRDTAWPSTPAPDSRMVAIPAGGEPDHRPAAGAEEPIPPMPPSPPISELTRKDFFVAACMIGMLAARRLDYDEDDRRPTTYAGMISEASAFADEIEEHLHAYDHLTEEQANRKIDQVIAEGKRLRDIMAESRGNKSTTR